MEAASLPFTERQSQLTFPESEQGLKVWSCVTCRRRKVKCDRRDPCANCIKNNIECHFPVTGRLPRRSRNPAAIRSPSQRQSELLGRLRRLEDLVTELSGQLEDGTPAQSKAPHLTHIDDSGLATNLLKPTHAWYPGAPISSDSYTDGGSAIAAQSISEVYEDFGRLVIGKGRGLRIDKGFWSVFCDEVEHIFQAIEGVSDNSQADEESGTMDKGAAMDQCHSYLFGTPCAFDAHADGELHPLPSQVPYIWNTYKENVDPFIKVLHTPTVDKIVSQTRGKFGALGPGVEALLFAISFAMITSLEEDDVFESFRVSKTEMVSRFRLGTERALGHSQMLTTKDIVVVQALTIYVSILPHHGAQQEASALSGALLRIAVRLGLHNEPTTSTYTPLDVETRRRLWWQICFMESRSPATSLLGLSFTEDSFNTKPPSNIQDQHITAGSDSLRPQDSMATPMMPTLVRCELWRLNQTLRRSQDKTLSAYMKIFREASSRVEDIYLQRLHVEDAFESFVKTIAALSLAKIEQALYRQHLRNCHTQDSHVCGLFFASSVAVMEAMRDLKTKPAWQRWRWQMQGHFPWHAVGAVFIQLCQLPWTPASERAWCLAQGLFDELPPSSRKDELWQRLDGLAKQANIYRDGQATGASFQATNFERQRNSLSDADEMPSQSPNLMLHSLPAPSNAPVTACSTANTSDLEGSGSSLGGSWEKLNTRIMSDDRDDVPLSSIIKEVLEEKGGAADHELYAVDEGLVGWRDWDDMDDFDIF